MQTGNKFRRRNRQNPRNNSYTLEHVAYAVLFGTVLSADECKVVKIVEAILEKITSPLK